MHNIYMPYYIVTFQIYNTCSPIERNGTRYWYNGKSIIAGDCGLVIEHPSSMDNGNWTCAAKLELFQNETEEFDTIHFAYETASSESGISEKIQFNIL